MQPSVPARRDPPGHDSCFEKRKENETESSNRDRDGQTDRGTHRWTTTLSLVEDEVRSLFLKSAERDDVPAEESCCAPYQGSKGEGSIR